MNKSADFFGFYDTHEFPSYSSTVKEFQFCEIIYGGKYLKTLFNPEGLK